VEVLAQGVSEEEAVSVAGALEGAVPAEVAQDEAGE